MAQGLNHTEAIALSHARLSGVQTRREAFGAALHAGEQAKLCYERIGDRLEAAKVDSTLVAIHLDTGDYQSAIAVGEKVIRFFEAIKNPHFAASTLVTLAQAYFHLDHYEQAEQMANCVLEYEEPYPVPYAYFTLGLVREAKKNRQEAALYFKRALENAAFNYDIL